MNELLPHTKGIQISLEQIVALLDCVTEQYNFENTKEFRYQYKEEILKARCFIFKQNGKTSLKVWFDNDNIIIWSDLNFCQHWNETTA